MMLFGTGLYFMMIKRNKTKQINTHSENKTKQINNEKQHQQKITIQWILIYKLFHHLQGIQVLNNKGFDKI